MLTIAIVLVQSHFKSRVEEPNFHARRLDGFVTDVFCVHRPKCLFALYRSTTARSAVGTTPSNRREEDLLMIAFKLIWLMHAACKGAMIQPVISWASEIMSIVD